MVAARTLGDVGAGIGEHPLRRGGGIVDGTPHGLDQLVVAGTFAVLMTQPIRELYQFGMAMAIGILLDTFVVRPLLVPAIVRLLGAHTLWPRRASAAVERACDRTEPAVR